MINVNNDLIFIEGNVPSLKNSKQFIPSRVTKNGKIIRSMLIPSKTVTKYLKSYEYQFMGRQPRLDFINNTNEMQPKLIGFHFVRGSKHKFDFGNACQIIQDLMVKHGWIEDDNMDFLIPIPFPMNGLWYSYNKLNPGVYIKIIKKGEIWQKLQDSLILT